MQLTKDEHQLLCYISLKNGYASFTHIQSNYGNTLDSELRSLVDKEMLMVYDECYWLAGKGDNYLVEYAKQSF